LRESRVNINGNMYRYRYNPETKATEYLGPVGGSSPLSEEDFLAMITIEGDTVELVPRSKEEIEDHVKDEKRQLDSLMDLGRWDEAKEQSKSLHDVLEQLADYQVWESLSPPSRRHFEYLLAKRMTGASGLEEGIVMGREDYFEEFDELRKLKLVIPTLTIADTYFIKLSPYGKEVADIVY